MKVLKLSGKTWLLIASGFLVIIVAGLVMVSFQRVDARDDLAKKLAASQAKLQGIHLEPLSAQQADLEKRLSQAAPELDAAKAKLAQPVSSTEAANVIFEAAKTYGLVVTGVTSTSPGAANVEGAALTAMSVTANVQGNASRVGGFIRALNSNLKTGAVTSVEISVPVAAASGNLTAQTSGSDNATASIKLVVYSYRGD